MGGLGGLIQANWLNPEVFGEFRKYSILTTYLSLGYCVVHDGLIRQYPYLLGKGDTKAALHIAGVAKWWYSFITILYISVFTVLSIIALLNQHYRAAIGWGAQITSSILMTYGAYLAVMYRTSANFKRLSFNNIISTVLGTFELVFVKIWDYWGLAIRFIILNLTSVWLNHHFLPVKVKALFDYKELRNLAKISLRFSVPGYLHSSALMASTNALILYFSGEGGLGIFAMAVMIQGMALTFTDALNQIFYVKITTKYGETEDVYKCLRYARFPALIGFLVSVILTISLLLIISPFIHFVLPKYDASINIIQILSFSIILKGASLPLIVIGSALWYKTFTFGCIVNFCFTLIIVIISPKTPTMIAAATISGQFAEMCVGYGSLIWNYRRIKIANRI